LRVHGRTGFWTIDSANAQPWASGRVLALRCVTGAGVVLIVHVAVLALSIAALGAAGLRCAEALGLDLVDRVLAAAAFGAAFAMSEALLLGLAGQGANATLLTLAAVLTWLLARFRLAATSLRTRELLADAWSRCGAAAQAAIGAAVVLASGMFGFDLWRPTFGDDGLSYHGAQPAVWMHTGHPGALHATLAFIPTQAYPKTMEVLIGWTYAIGRTPLAAVPLTFGLVVLAAVAVVAGLRRAGVSTAVATTAAAAGLLVPIDVREFNGLYTDVPAVGWLAASVVLSSTARRRPVALGPAAVAAGLAIGTKPTVAPFALIALGWAAWVHRSRLGSTLRWVAAPAAWALGVGAVWYVEDWVSYGGPLWPFSRFPNGSPTPFIWLNYGTRFFDDPSTTVHAIGLHGYLLVLGGALILLAALPVLVVAALFPAGRAVRRTVLVGALLIAGQLVFWAESDFTGLAHGALYLVYAGLRYLAPALLAAAVLMALATRTTSRIRYLPITVLGLAVLPNVWELRHSIYRSPIRPSAVICLALLLAGAVLGWLVARTGRLPRLLRSMAVGPAVVVVAALAMAVSASGYFGHYLLVAQRQGSADAPILDYLRDQPSWAHGGLPVAAGPEAFASLAGPRFAHPLSLVGNDEPCESVRAAASRGWLVLTARPAQPFAALDYVHAPNCMTGVTPAATLPGGVTIYGPAQ
jgi:hypothetical protein